MHNLFLTEKPVVVQELRESQELSFDRFLVAAASDSNVVGFEFLGKFQDRSTALIAVHNLLCPVFDDGIMKRCDAKVGMHGVGEPPRQDSAAGPFHYGHQEASLHRQVDLKNENTNINL
jgi:hypothetical protein